MSLSGGRGFFRLSPINGSHLPRGSGIPLQLRGFPLWLAGCGRHDNRAELREEHGGQRIYDFRFVEVAATIKASSYFQQEQLLMVK